MNKNKNIIVNYGSDSDLSSTVFDANLIKDYNYAISESGDLDKSQLDILLKNFNDSDVYNLSTRDTCFIYVKTNEYFFSIISYNFKKYSVGLHTITLKLLEKYFKLVQDIISESTSECIKIKLEDISLQLDGNIKINKSEKTLEELQSSSTSLYYPYLDTDVLFDQYLRSDDNLLVLSGMPGTGKTKLANLFLQYCINNYDLVTPDKEYVNPWEPLYEKEVKVIYVKNEDILSIDEFWHNLKKDNSPKIVILDDLDYALLPRSRVVDNNMDINKNKFISHLLSYTDGVFNEGNNTKIIITTNTDIKDIDSAVLRKGRTFDILHLRTLKNKEAKSIWNKLVKNKTKFKAHFTSSEVLQSDLGSKINLMNNTPVKLLDKGYLKEDNISTLEKVNKIKNENKTTSLI